MATLSRSLIVQSAEGGNTTSGDELMQAWPYPDGFTGHENVLLAYGSQPLPR